MMRVNWNPSRIAAVFAVAVGLCILAAMQLFLDWKELNNISPGGEGLRYRIPIHGVPVRWWTYLTSAIAVWMHFAGVRRAGAGMSIAKSRKGKGAVQLAQVASALIVLTWGVFLLTTLPNSVVRTLQLFAK